MQSYCLSCFNVNHIYFCTCTSCYQNNKGVNHPGRYIRERFYTPKELSSYCLECLFKYNNDSIEYLSGNEMHNFEDHWDSSNYGIINIKIRTDILRKKINIISNWWQEIYLKRRKEAATKIQNWWLHDILFNPRHKVCIKYRNKKYYELSSEYYTSDIIKQFKYAVTIIENMREYVNDYYLMLETCYESEGNFKSIKEKEEFILKTGCFNRDKNLIKFFIDKTTK